MTDNERRWCSNAAHYGGSFVKTFAQSALYADDVNLELIRPVLTQMMEKYPKYGKAETE